MSGGINDSILISPDTRYAVDVIFSNSAGHFDVISQIFSKPSLQFNHINILTIGTFDVHNTSLSLGDGSICVKCIFISNSSANGCVVEVVAHGDVVATITAIRHNNSDSVEGCVSDIDSGIYNITIYYAYDKNDDGSVDNTSVTVYRDVTLTITATTTRTPICPSSVKITSSEPITSHTLPDLELLTTSAIGMISIII